MPGPLLPVAAAAASKIPLIGAGIQAGTSIFNNAVNALLTGRNNRRQEDFARSMYDRQRADAIADRDFMLQYNSPEAQMNRFKQAGLNPNLIYGNVNTDTPSVRSSSVPSYNPSAPQLDLSGVASSIDTFQDLRIKQMTEDNLAAQNKVIQQEAILKAVQSFDTLMSGKGKEFDLGIKQDTRGVMIEMINENLRKLKADINATERGTEKTIAETGAIGWQVKQIQANINNLEASRKVMLDRNDREKIKQGYDIDLILTDIYQKRIQALNTIAQTLTENQMRSGKVEQLNQEIARTKEAIKTIRSENVIKRIEAGLAEKGILRNDRALERAIQNIGGTILKIGREGLQKAAQKFLEVKTGYR